MRADPSHSKKSSSSAPDAGQKGRPNIGALLWLWPIFKQYKSRIFGLFLSLVLAAGSVLSLGHGIRVLINQGLTSGNNLQLEHAIAFLVVVVMFMAVASYWRLLLVTWLGEHALAHIRQQIFDRLLNQPISFFEKKKVGDLLACLHTDTTLIQVLISTSLPVAFRNLLIFIGGTIMLFLTSVKLAAMVFLIVPLVILPISLYGKRVKKSSRKTQEAAAEMNAIAEETLYAIKTIQSFVLEDFTRAAFTSAINKTVQSAMMQIKQRAKLTVSVMVIAFSAVSFVLLWGGFSVLEGNLTGGDLSAFIFYAIVVASSLNTFGDVAGELQRSAGAAERVQELLNLQQTPLNTGTKLPATQGNIAFEHVSFAYPARPNVPVLKDVSFQVKPGEMVAFVGPSGAGKTTILQLLLRFYQATSGQITVEGHAVDAVSLASLRAQFALVAQDPIIFSTTLYQNILYGNPSSTRAEVVAAAKTAAVDDFVKDLADGYETLVGEKGIRLSGGQKQRLALARALLKKAPILLLDEATSALDSHSEHKVQQALVAVRDNHTLLVIAHRLSTIKKADRILVLDHGTIVEEGTHETLMQKKGVYHSLATLQFDA